MQPRQQHAPSFKARDVRAVSRIATGPNGAYDCCLILLMTDPETVVWFEEHFQSDNLRLNYNQMLYTGSCSMLANERVLDWLITHRKADASRFISPQKMLVAALTARLPPLRIRWMIKNKMVAFADTETPRYFHLAVTYPRDQVVELLELLLASGEIPGPMLLEHSVTAAEDPSVTIPWLLAHGCAFPTGALDKVPRRLRDGWSVRQCIELTQWLMDAFSLEMGSAYYVEALRWSHKAPIEQLLRWALPYCQPNREYISASMAEHRRWHGKLGASQVLLVCLLLQAPSPSVKIA